MERIGGRCGVVGGAEFLLIEQEGSRYSEFETAKRCLDSWKSMFAKA
jgi:hypothetical protein